MLLRGASPEEESYDGVHHNEEYQKPTNRYGDQAAPVDATGWVQALHDGPHRDEEAGHRDGSEHDIGGITGVYPARKYRKFEKYWEDDEGQRTYSENVKRLQL